MTLAPPVLAAPLSAARLPTSAGFPSPAPHTTPNRWQFRACIKVLAEVLTWLRPADGILSAFFRQNASLGLRDRAVVAETTYAIVRHLRAVQGVCAPVSSSPKAHVLAWLLHGQGLSPTRIKPWLEPEEEGLLAALAARVFVPETLAQALDSPDWLCETLCAHYGEETTRALLLALNTPAPLTVRANLTQTDRKALQDALLAQGIHTRPTLFSPWGLTLEGHPNVAANPLFKAGAFEVQDEGSQLLALLLGARRGERVVDFCAGAGGKTLAIGAMMRSTGQIYALDVAEKRLQKLRKRVTRAGLSNVQPWVIETENDSRLKALHGKANRVLVDAPCSGLGTLRRNPDLKWRQNPKTVSALEAQQAAILQSASRLVQNKGVVLYATCSLLPSENEDIVTAFLEANSHFVLEDACERLRTHGLDLGKGPFLKLRPDQHGCDGFFAALMTRCDRPSA